ncbi:MAG: stage II sporulation protein M [Candidatus Aenigmarchaeota archaeon]|nr:stage II sporulation protein M [Candidatus Aenigmarchaeota archaeon]
MGLTDIFNGSKFDEHPYYSFIVAMLFVFIGFLFALFIFPAEFSIAMVSFSTILIVPYMLIVLTREEMEKNQGIKSAFQNFSKHNRVILLFIFFFFGMAIEYMLLFAFVPPDVTELAFGNQLMTISDTPSKYFLNMDFLFKILINNLRLVFICYVLSLFYGIGALFILSYNASIVGTVYGNTLRPLIWGGSMATFAITKLVLFLPHLITEVIAYLLAAIAGVLLLKSMSGKSPTALTESIVILMGAVALTIFAGVLEIFVPFLF